MKAIKQFKWIFGITLTVVAFNFAFAQEYDDLYFTAKDRKVAKAKKLENDDSRATYQSYTNNTYTDKYSAHEVNPEYIARYKSNAESDNENVELSNQNATYGQPSFSNISYFPEEESPEGQGNATTIINNYYGSTARNNWNDPYWGVNTGFGYSPWNGWRSGWNISFGLGWGWNSWNDPFYWGYPGYAGGYFAYDPFWGWGYPSYYSGYWGYGWNRWGRYNYAYNNGFYDGLYYGGNYNNKYYGENSGRQVVRGGGRSSSYTSDRSRLNSSNSRIANTSRSRSSVSGNANTNTSNSSRVAGSSRDYSRTQNEYFSRSRSGLSSGRSSSESSSGSRSSSGSYNYNSRSNSSNSGYRPSSSSDNSTRRYSSSESRSNSRYSGSSGTYSNRGSGTSGTRTYSTPSRSSSPRSNYSAPSRSSGRSYTPSRSSGSSSGRSYSPGSSSGSRSSGSSGSSRSSGGSRSSSSSRRGGGR